MNARSMLTWLTIPALATLLVTTSGGADKPVRATGAAKLSPNALRARPALGAAPKTEFKVGNRTIPLDKGDPGVKAVRLLPPKSFDKVSRRRSVEEFYKKELAAKAPVKAELERWYVGPFRPEFVYWARYNWLVRDRAEWAWNNRRYFDLAMWNQWMQEPQFATLIGQFDSRHLPQKAGFVPEQYASSPAEVIYSDQYIDAVYNPIYTMPSIIVDGSAGARLENLIEGASRTFGGDSALIASLADAADGLQFLSVPAKFDPTYQIEVKRDGILYIFGPRKTPLQDGVGDDAPKWHVVSNLINGPGIQAVYQRKVTAGDKIRLHGYEWSVASEQIDVLDSASKEATTALGLVDAVIGQMLKSDDGILQAEPELKDYLLIAQGAEQGMLTQLGNVDQDKIGLYYAALDKTQRMSLTAASQSGDRKLAASARDFARRVNGLEDSLNEVEELRNPDAVAPDTGMITVQPSPADTEEQSHKITNSLAMTLIRIQPGSFNMGSPETEPGHREDETLHRVTLTTAFFMGATDVTVGQFTQFVNATGFQTNSEKIGSGNVYDGASKAWTHVSGLSFRNPGYEQTDDYPVVFVNWNDAKAFCDWLTTKENKHYRLPTEAEWEYACRAGTTSAFNTGDGNAAMGNAEWIDQKVHPVAQKQPNAWGLFDMHGNVRQWCNDLFAPYPATDATDPIGSVAGGNPVTRGGDAWHRPGAWRSAARSHADHQRWSDHSIGFRVVLDAPVSLNRDAVNAPAPTAGAAVNGSNIAVDKGSTSTAENPRFLPAQSLTAGSIWLPSDLSQHLGAPMTVVSFDGKTLVLDDRGGNGSVHRWTVQVDEQGQLQVTSIEPVKVPKDAPLITDIHISGSVTADTLTLTGTRSRGNIPSRFDMTYKRQP